ncbi:esterase [Bordetella genomosp. 9]|uniref:Esterase n=1 Tax=Bordetella genomosp. 9 TaxID=1416803 RepID=A0A261REE5_9BORD|nr:esterase [Bordetella genomosp. 9]OZI23147.1 esterase [Bordetella genomosp. 9]
MPKLARSIAVLAAMFACVAMQAAHAQSVDVKQPLTIASQGSFFVGGREVKSETLSTLPQVDPTGTVTVEQMYVQYQVPVDAKPVQVVFIHGCCLTGASWETTPDGRMGWSEYFVRKGYPTYVIDQAARGRSAMNAAAIYGVKTGKLQPDTLPVGFQAGREVAWPLFRFGPRYPESYAGSQYPVEAQEALWKQMVPDWAYSMSTPNPTVPALNLLAQRLGRAVLVSHSQSGIYPFQAAVRGRAGIAAIVSIEPAACPAADSDLTPYAGIPIMVLFGDYVAQSAVWAPRLAACEAFAQAVNKAGGKAKVLQLPQAGMHGNTHMLMQDRNNLLVADLLSDWIDNSVGR